MESLQIEKTMSENSENSQKPHEPTPHKLNEARKKGDVFKSQDLSTAAALVGVLFAFSAFGAFAFDHFLGLFSFSIELQNFNFQYSFSRIIYESFYTLLVCTFLFIIPVVVLTIFFQFLQVGSLFATEKVGLDFDKINPIQGMKRIFNLKIIIETIKNFLIVSLILFICILLTYQSLPDAFNLIYVKPHSSLMLLWEYGSKILFWSSVLFLFIGILDYVYQRHSYMQRMRMSESEIKQEFKQSEGDPMMKNQRRQLHREWSTRNVTYATSTAKALVTNPTHIAIAIQYDPDESPLPMVIAKGEGAIAALMRLTAEEHSVPVIQNIELARGLNENAELDNPIPEDYFEAVAEVLLWAQDIRNNFTDPKALT